jgi:general secretion pathway protein N
LTLAPHVSLRSEWGSQKLDGDIILRGQRDLDVRDLDANMAATLLGQFAPVAVEGSFNLQVAHLQLRNGLPHTAKGRLIWKDGGWRSPQGLVPLGTFALDFEQAQGEALQGKVITLAGPLQADGSVQLRERHYEVDILLGSEQTFDQQLGSMLSLIATPENAGFRIGMKGDF